MCICIHICTGADHSWAEFVYIRLVAAVYSARKVTTTQRVRIMTTYIILLVYDYIIHNTLVVLYMQ